MDHIREALAIFRRDPRLWRYAWAPLIWALLLFLGLVAVAFWLFDSWIHGLSRGADMGPVLRAVADLGFLVVLYFAGTAAYLALAALLGSFGWDKLTGEIEHHITGRQTQMHIGCATNVVDTVLRLVFTVALVVAGLCVSWIPVAGPALVGGILGLFDLTANAYLRRGVTLGGQFGRVFKLKGWPAFVAITGLVALVPVLNLLMLPILVAAGTVMVVRSEGSA
jgi:uncharacterized protein involved in cysteine biosynthesis